MIPIQLRQWVKRHPITSFFSLTYFLSWGIWLPLIVGYKGILSNALFLAGIFGPALAAGILTQQSRRSIVRWLRGILRWRISIRWYFIALGFPILLIGTVSLLFALLGYPANFWLLLDRGSDYLSELIFVAFLGGGQEEFGWRGFALPHLQRRYSPVISTLILGIFWSFWHLPIVMVNPEFQHGLAIADFLPVIFITFYQVIGYAFCLTWLFNRTQSVLLTILLHASFNTANQQLVPLPLEQMQGSNYQVLSVIMTLVLTIVVIALITSTKGKLGYKAQAKSAETRAKV
ncbi:CPBP family intramembrane metalloprotease [Pleurocapsales cyanobacterium LEGE 10410]|nr:CPBP family intramembrane metalloprotease [Pleurocapsales cyanobacterium LEGE 10410]